MISLKVRDEIFTPIQRNRLNYGSVHLNLHIHFDIVVGFVWSDDPERYADCRVATGRVSCAREFKSDGTDKKRYPAAPGRGFSEGLRTPSLKNTHCEDPQ